MMKRLLVDQFLLHIKKDTYLQKLASHLRWCSYFYYAIWIVFLSFGGYLTWLVLFQDLSENVFFIGGVLLFGLLVFLWRYSKLLSLQKSAFDFLLKESIFPQILQKNDWTMFTYKEREKYQEQTKNTLEKIEKMGLRGLWNSFYTYIKDRFSLLITAPLFVLGFNIAIAFVGFLLFWGYPRVVVLLVFCVALLASEPLKYGLFKSDFWFFSCLNFFRTPWDRVPYYLSFETAKRNGALFEISRLPWWYRLNTPQEKLLMQFRFSQAFWKKFYVKLTPQLVRRGRFLAFLKLFLLVCLLVGFWACILFLILVDKAFGVGVLILLFAIIALSPLFDPEMFKKRFNHQKALLFGKHLQVKALFSLDFQDYYHISTNDQVLAHTFLNPAVKEVLMKLYQESDWKYSFYLENHHFYGLKHLKKSQKLTPFSYQNPKHIELFCEHLAEFLMLSKVIK